MMTPDIIVRHKDWVVINKPEGYAVEELMQLWAGHFSAFHPVHRLDKDTSGLWLIALNTHANAILSAQFERREVTKRYLVLSTKKAKKKQGRVKGDMIRSRRSQWRLTTSQQNPAITLFQSVSYDSPLRLVICQPITGKTHQIRVAMKALGSPVAGDRIYAKGEAEKFDRLYLHAFHLEFDWVSTRQRFTVLPTSGIYFDKDCLQESLQMASLQYKVG